MVWNLQLVMNWRHATQNNISAPSIIWQTKKMPNQNNDLALVGMKHQFDNGFYSMQLIATITGTAAVALPVFGSTSI